MNACSGGGMDCSVSSGGGGTLRWYELQRATRQKRSHTDTDGTLRAPHEFRVSRPVHATSAAVAPRVGCAPEKMQVRSEQRRSVSYSSPPHVITQGSPPARSSAHTSLPKGLLADRNQLEPIHRDTRSVHSRPLSCSQASSSAQKHQRTCRLPCKSARTALGGDARSASPRLGRPAPALRPRPPPFESETPPGCGRHRPTTPPDQSASPATSATTPGIAASRGQRAVGQPPKRRHGRRAWRQQHP